MNTSEKAPRIAKVLAERGFCSRREAERWIEQGRVKVDGQVLTTPAFCVMEGHQILVDDQPIPQKESSRLWIYHKPKGLVTTHRDPEGRPTVFESLPSSLPRVVSVGRLDQYSEGLLLLTNDGELARRLELPSSQLTRVYKVRIFGQISAEQLKSLEKGITLEGIYYQGIKAFITQQKGSNTWIEMHLKEGKNREIRKIMASFGLSVNRLIRIAYGPYALGTLTAGQVKEVPLKDFS